MPRPAPQGHSQPTKPCPLTRPCAHYVGCNRTENSCVVVGGYLGLALRGSYLCRICSRSSRNSRKVLRRTFWKWKVPPASPSSPACIPLNPFLVNRVALCVGEAVDGQRKTKFKYSVGYERFLGPEIFFKPSVSGLHGVQPAWWLTPL